MIIKFEDIELNKDYLVTQYDGYQFEGHFDGDFWKEYSPMYEDDYDDYAVHSKESVIKIETIES